MTPQQERKLYRMNEDMDLSLDWWIDHTDINPTDIPFPDANTMEYGCYTYEVELNPKPDRIYDGHYFQFRHRDIDGNTMEHPHLEYDDKESSTPFYIFREKLKPKSNWYDLIEVAAKLHTRSTDWQHHGFSGTFEPHDQYDDVLKLWINS